METVREWLMGVVACAMLLGICRRFAGSGAVGEIVKFTGGLLLLLALIAPVRQVELEEIALDFSLYERALHETEKTLFTRRENEIRQGIEVRTSAYIEAKSAELGQTIRAQVTAEETDGVWLPRRAVLYGARSESLAQWMEETLGIVRQAQEWRESD